MELFERDWVLNQWAKRMYDANGDGVISVDEAQPATATGGSPPTNMAARGTSSSLATDLASAGHPLGAEAEHHLVGALVG